jgi:ribosomal protein L16 Arg81 hydroxylase
MTQAETMPAQSEGPQIGDLPHLLGSTTVKEFFESVWNKRALYLQGDSDKFRGLFDKAAFYRGLENCMDLKIGYTDERGWPAHQKIEPSQVAEMLASGKTICASSIEGGNDNLKEFLGRIRKPFALLGHFIFNAYLSPDGAGFGLHLDHHPVFILQIEGEKQWWYSPEPALKRVITNVSFPDAYDSLELPWTSVSRPAEESLRQVVLRPGDVLYLPKGSWHRAKAIGGSLGLTLAMESAAPLDLVQPALRPHLNTIELRDSLPAFDRQSFDQEMPLELEEIFEGALEQLKSLLGAITARDLYNLWKHRS